MANLIHVYDPVTGQPTLLTAAQVLALVGAARTSPDFRIQLIASGVAGLAVTTSVAEAELSVSLHRRQADLTNMVAIRLGLTLVTTLGAASSSAKLQYTTDLTGASGWKFLDDAASGATWASSGATGALALDTMTLLRPAFGAWTSLPASAKAAVLLRAVTGGAIGAPVVLDGCIEAR